MCANSVHHHLPRRSIVLLLLVYFPSSICIWNVGPTHTGFYRTTPSNPQTYQDDHDVMTQTDIQIFRIMVVVGVVTFRTNLPWFAGPCTFPAAADAPPQFAATRVGPEYSSQKSDYVLWYRRLPTVVHSTAYCANSFLRGHVVCWTPSTIRVFLFLLKIKIFRILATVGGWLCAAHRGGVVSHSPLGDWAPTDIYIPNCESSNSADSHRSPRNEQQLQKNRTEQFFCCRRIVTHPSNIMHLLV